MARKKGPERREEILIEAERVFAEHSFSDTTLEDVATALGITRQALYHYFPSKEDILIELAERAGRLIAALAEKAIAEQQTPSEALTTVLVGHVRALLEHRDLFRIQFAELDRLGGGNGDMLRRGQAAYVRQIATLIERGQSDGEFVDGPPITLALLVLGMANSIVNWVDNGPNTDDGTLDLVTGCALRSIRTVAPEQRESASA